MNSWYAVVRKADGSVEIRNACCYGCTGEVPMDGRDHCGPYELADGEVELFRELCDRADAEEIAEREGLAN